MCLKIQTDLSQHVWGRYQEKKKKLVLISFAFLFFGLSGLQVTYPHFFNENSEIVWSHRVVSAMLHTYESPSSPDYVDI